MSGSDFECSRWKVEMVAHLPSCVPLCPHDMKLTEMKESDLADWAGPMSELRQRSGW